MRWVVALTLVTACYSPQPSPGAPCPDGICPTSLVCSPATHTCELHPVDAGTIVDSPRLIDARIDGPPDAYVPPTPVLRQQAVNYNAAASTLNATFPMAPTAGNVLVMIGGTPPAPFTSVTGGGVTAWQLAKKSTVETNVEIWYGITNGSSSTVTVTLMNGGGPIWLSVSEWSALTGSLDAATANDGVTGPASAGTLTTTKRDLLILGFSQFVPTTIGTPSPGTWTAMTPIDGNAVKQREWYRVEPTPGAYTPTFSVSNSGWDAALVGFEIQN